MPEITAQISLTVKISHRDLNMVSATEAIEQLTDRVRYTNLPYKKGDPLVSLVTCSGLMVECPSNLPDKPNTRA